MDFNKPRIAIYYYVLKSTGFRNDGAPLFLLYNLRKVLDGLSPKTGEVDMLNKNTNVLHLFPHKADQGFGNFDLHVWVDHGEDALNVPLGWIPPSPNCYVVSDAHLGYDYRLNMAKKFDFVFCNQKSFMKRFETDGVPKEKLFYMPHAFEETIYKPWPIIKKWDWAFVGYLNSEHRVDLLDAMAKKFPEWYIGWRDVNSPGHNIFEDAAKKFCQAKIVVNDAIKEDLNMRVFEVLGSKTCLLTQAIEELDGVFENMRHLVTYQSIPEALELADWLLKNPDERERIASEGHAEVMAKHTYQRRVLEILKATIGYEPKGEDNAIIENCAV